MPTAPRDADELLLDMLRLRTRGLTPTAIAAKFGLGVQYVSTATNRVRRADAAESGEDVAGAYWADSEGRG
jgi:hypothetical protein